MIARMMLSCVALVACGRSAPPPLPFGTIDQGALDRIYSICAPDKTPQDPVLLGAKSVPAAYKQSVTAPVMRTCKNLDGLPESWITMVRDEKTGQVVSLTIDLRAPAGTLTLERVDRILAVAMDPWIKVATPVQIRELVRQALAEPGKSSMTEDGRYDMQSLGASPILKGPTWYVTALAGDTSSQIGGAASHASSLHIDAQPLAPN